MLKENEKKFRKGENVDWRKYGYQNRNGKSEQIDFSNDGCRRHARIFFSDGLIQEASHEHHSLHGYKFSVGYQYPK